MACKCKCGKPKACDEELCDRCFIDSLHDEASKNIATGGRFYEKKDKAKDD